MSMPREYVTLCAAESELIVLRSRFLAIACHIDSEEDAAEKLAALRKKYYDATHVCYAYVADASGFTCKSSDDGEPASTAGAPIMNVICGGAYRFTLIAVVRWFGGTKLGVGGLIKAYTDAAAAVCEKAEKQTYVLSSLYEAEVGYETLDKIKNAVITGGGKISDIQYGDAARLTIALPEESGLIGALTDLTRGKTKFIPRGQKYEFYRMQRS